MSIPILLITGATSGLGLNTVKLLAKTSNFNFIAGVRQPNRAINLKSVVPKKRLTLLPLNLASMISIRQFASTVTEHLDNHQLTAIALNAGIQITTGLEKSADGYERTFATNYLGHFLLTHLLMPVMSENAIVISTASGTHDPQDLVSRLFSFRGGFFPSAEAVAKGVIDTSVNHKQQCLDRYATSKLCNILFTYDMARRIPPKKIRFLAFDPGLMPGTALARDRGAIEQFAWKYLLPLLRLFVPGVSSPHRSSRSLSDLLSDQAIALTTGTHFDYRLKQTRTSIDSYREDWQQQLHEMSVRLTGI